MPVTVQSDNMEDEEEDKIILSEWPLLLPSALVAHLVQVKCSVWGCIGQWAYKLYVKCSLDPALLCGPST